NNYVFLAMVLVIPLIEYAKISFDIIVEYLTRLKNYKLYYLNLRSTAKKFFKLIAVE
ncbi:uncharacterized protein K441DRAFT_583927, partial [Cenococcum geophilum 1.58]|uniref:uncharacterized protein n=1 Tax=Cenococcum geophilum 1.58 TaxID=794803 RepID=UPI00358F9E9C